MATTLTPGTGAEPDSRRPRRKAAARVGVTSLVVALVGLVVAALVLFAWMVNEEHFDRPSAEFDELASAIDLLPGVEAVEKERWVEAPTFSNPTSWMAVTVDQAGLAGLLDAACAMEYPDAVVWTRQLPRIFSTPSAALSTTLADGPPSVTSTAGFASSIWRSMNGRQISVSCGVGVRLPGGRQGMTLAM